MWKKQEFISNSLPKLRGKITDAANQVLNVQTASLSQSVPSSQNSETQESVKPLVDENFRKALEKRREEFNKTRRDVLSRLTETTSVIPEEINSYREIIAEMEKSQESFNELMGKLNSIDEASWDKENYSADLADAMKTIENSRLEYLRLSARLDKVKSVNCDQGDIVRTTNSSILPELLSLSFRQLVKFGLFITLPIAASLIVAAFIIVLGMLIAMR